jgi:chemotaxis family two-component system sensor kinase Cph1
MIVYFIVSAIVALFVNHPFVWRTDMPAIKDIHTIAGIHMRYLEVQPGIYTELMGLIGFFVFIYIFGISIQLYRDGFRAKARPIFWVTGIFCAGLVNDASVHDGFYRFIYVIEFAYLGIVLLMAYTLSNALLESVVIKDALRESERKYRELVDNSLVGIFIFQETLLVFCNRRFAEIFGYANPKELIGKKEESFLSPENVDALGEAIKRFGSGETVVDAMEIKGIQKQGRAIDLEVLLNQIQYQGMPAIQGSLIDITDRKQAHDALKKQALVLRRNHEELQQFAYLTSHDLQEPLRSISGFVQLLAQKYRDRLDKQANEYIEFAVQGVTRMERLIADFLLYAQLGHEYIMTPAMDVEYVVDRAVSRFSAVLDEYGAEIACEPLPTLACDQERMQNVFEHLIDNALKFNGGKPRVRISASRSPDENAWIFAVKDNGIGIPKEYHERIFGLFKRLHPHGVYPGTGIGLPVCKKIIEGHGGRIWVESEEGRGSTFYFSLPVDSGNPNI